MNKKIAFLGLLFSVLLLTAPVVAQETGSKSQEAQEKIEVPLLGELDASSTPLFLLTSVISFIDGLNPCSLWVLTFLLGIVIYAGKKKVIMVGLTFLFVTATVYGLFIAGALSVFHYISHLAWIRFLVAGIALIFAAISIKDFFWYKKGVSLTIPEKYKPDIYSKIRGVMKKEKNIPTIIATAIMAAGVALVELPCTAGLPMVWSNVVAERGVGIAAYIALLLLYILIYLSVELVIFFFAVWRMKKIEFGKKKGRILKLVGGSIMLMLGLVMMIDYTLLESMEWTFTAFAITIAASLLFAKAYIMSGRFEESEKDDEE